MRWRVRFEGIEGNAGVSDATDWIMRIESRRTRVGGPVPCTSIQAPVLFHDIQNMCTLVEFSIRSQADASNPVSVNYSGWWTPAGISVTSRFIAFVV